MFNTIQKMSSLTTTIAITVAGAVTLIMFTASIVLNVWQHSEIVEEKSKTAVLEAQVESQANDIATIKQVLKNRQ